MNSVLSKAGEKMSGLIRLQASQRDIVICKSQQYESRHSVIGFENLSEDEDVIKFVLAHSRAKPSGQNLRVCSRSGQENLTLFHI
jgi:hypothetical protein